MEVEALDELEDLAEFIESLNRRGRSRADASTKQRLTRAHVKREILSKIIDLSNHHRCNDFTLPVLFEPRPLRLLSLEGPGRSSMQSASAERMMIGEGIEKVRHASVVWLPDSQAVSQTSTAFSTGCQSNCLDGLAEACRCARPNFDKGTEALRENFTRASRSVATKLADMKDELDVTACTRQIRHQTSVVATEIIS